MWLFVSETGNRKYNGQCEQSFGKIERIAKQISVKRKNQEESGEIRWIEQPYQDILTKVDRGGLNVPTPGRIGLIVSKFVLASEMKSLKIL